MRKWMQSGVVLAFALLLLPGCSGGKSADSGDNAPSAGAVGNESQDDKITKAVQAKLAADPALKGEDIKVKVTGGQVELTGTVKSIEASDKAEAAVREAIKDFKSVNAGVVNNTTVAEGKPAGGADASGKK